MVDMVKLLLPIMTTPCVPNCFVRMSWPAKTGFMREKQVSAGGRSASSAMNGDRKAAADHQRPSHERCHEQCRRTAPPWVDAGGAAGGQRWSGARKPPHLSYEATRCSVLQVRNAVPAKLGSSCE
jgi:hypothetical protein